MNVAEIMNILERQGFIAEGTQAHPMKGTTEGTVYRLASSSGTEYALKVENPPALAQTVKLLLRYADSPLLSKVVYADPEHRFLLYDYKKGTTHIGRGQKRQWMKLLVEQLLNVYTRESNAAYCGNFEHPRSSWSEFNHYSLQFAQQMLQPHLPERAHAVMAELAGSRLRNWSGEQLFMLHGDTGVHNFVYDRETIVGVIDPYPTVGPVVYDLTYAFCSSPDDLTPDTLLEAYDLLREKPLSRGELMQETAFQLYCRLAICRLHHPQDWEAYMQAWPSWLALVDSP